ncbi:hypothetical protein HaLaN_09908, partial [Haematococcus lacustris]
MDPSCSCSQSNIYASVRVRAMNAAVLQVLGRVGEDTITSQCYRLHGQHLPHYQVSPTNRKPTPGNQNDAASQPRGFYLCYAHHWMEDSVSYVVQLVTLNIVQCAECYGGSNLDIQIHSSCPAAMWPLAARLEM